MSVLWIKGSCPRFELNKSRIEELASKIKPIRFSADGIEQIMVTDLYNIAFTWDPAVKKIEFRDAEGQLDGLYEVARIETHHTCGYIAMFKPTISEVLAQIPEHLIKESTEPSQDTSPQQRKPSNKMHSCDDPLCAVCGHGIVEEA